MKPGISITTLRLSAPACGQGWVSAPSQNTVASSGIRNSPSASSNEGRLGLSLLRDVTCATPRAIGLLWQFARATSEPQGVCRAKPHPHPNPIIHTTKYNHSLINRSIIFNAYTDDFIGTGAIRHRTTCALMQQLSA